MTTKPDTIRQARTWPWPRLGWVLFALAAVGLGVGILTGLLMRSALLDVVSFWPAWVLALLISMALWPLKRKGIVRIGAVLPLLLFSWLAVAVSLHLQAWELLPSAGADFSGPTSVGLSSATLALQVGGLVEIGNDAEVLYEIELLRKGGDVAPPEALERVADGSAIIELRERGEAGWFASAGWRLDLSRDPIWQLAIIAQDVDADLRGLTIGNLSVIADGTVRLGIPADDIEVTVNGDLRLIIPAATAIELEGAASTPQGWEKTETGSRFEAAGPVIRIISLGLLPIEILYP